MTKTPPIRHVLGAIFAAALTLGTAQAIVLVPSNVSFNMGTGVYTYSYSVTNNNPTFDLAIVNVPVAFGSNLQNLSSPLGFASAFDPGVSIVSFFEDADPGTLPTFSPGTTQGLFSFTSTRAPALVAFDALDVSGDTYSGTTQAPGVGGPVPEAGSTLPLLTLAMLGLVVCTLPKRTRVLADVATLN